MNLARAVEESNRLRNVEGDLKSAVKVLQRALRGNRFSRGRSIKVKAWQQLGTLYRDEGEVKEARRCYRNALYLARKMQDKALEADVLRAKAFLTLQISNRFRTALSQAQQALKLLPKRSQDLNIQKVRTDVYALLGNIYCRRESFDEALKFYKKGLKLAGRFNIEQRLITISGDIGNVYLLRGQLRRAEAYLKKALTSARKYYQHAVVSLLIRLARVSFLKGDFKKAEGLCQEALEIARQQGWRFQEAEALESLGYIYQSVGRFRESKEVFSTAHKIFKQIAVRR